jgi:CopG family nickel-responsive transcriptional regulator
MAEDLVRFSITVPRDVLDKFDKNLTACGKCNRSYALRQLMRGYIAGESWRREEGWVYGTITLMYDHHAPCTMKALTSLQHDHGAVIVCTMHVHVTHDTCLECIVLAGDASEVRAFVNALGQVRGIHSLDPAVIQG